MTLLVDLNSMNYTESFQEYAVLVDTLQLLKRERCLKGIEIQFLKELHQ
jgi:hypothetical protein